ncbi:MAG: CehA/McbA family metallohydrolase [Anaerolineaceae bacterium]|jgi:hypothetical protein
MNSKITHQPLPSYHFEGKIPVPEDKGYVQNYLDFPFDVPEGVGALNLRLRYTPTKVGEINNLITLGLFDPHGFRGNAHRNPPDEQVVLSPVTTTPGFLPGPILAGRWLAQLASQVIMPSEPPCAFSLDINLLPTAEGRRISQAITIAPRQAAGAAKAGWYRGELHSHTLHSDGKLTVQELIAEAHRFQLDFLAITDHNTTSALAQVSQVDQAALDGLLVIPGLELTSFYGHALALGVEDWVDWRTDYQGWTMEDAARCTHELGGLFIIAHPNDVGTPFCTGCHWDDTDFDLGLVDGVEIWNDRWRNPAGGNPLNLDWWQRLQSGPRSRSVPATCGADYHEPGMWGEGVAFSYVYAASLSTAGILEGICRGKLILSSGPRLSLRVSPGDGAESAGIGDTLHTRSRRVRLELAWTDVPSGARLQVHGQQGLMVDKAIAETGSLQPLLEIPAQERLWVEIYTADGGLSALTNPVFIEGNYGK